MASCLVWKNNPEKYYKICELYAFSSDKTIYET